MLPRPNFASLSTTFLAAALCMALTACTQEPAPAVDALQAKQAIDANAAAAKAAEASMAALPLDELRKLASTATREQRLYFPAGNNAVEYYLALRKKTGKPDALTESALMDLTPYTVIAAEQAIARSDFEEAARLRDLITSIDGGAPALPRISRAISEGLKNNETLASLEVKRQQDALLLAEKTALKEKQDALKLSPATAEVKPAAAAALPPSPEPVAATTVPAPVAPATSRNIAATPTSAPIKKQDLIAIRTPAPAFPSDAMNRGLSGAVEIEFTVQKNGEVSEVRIVNSNQRAFDRNVLATVKRWKFGPLDEPMTVRRSFNFNNPS